MDPHREQTIEVSLATPEDRPEIYAIRHQVYARELGQHPVNAAGMLQDPLDDIRWEERRVGKECRSRWSPYH